jgi:hypothetical protein
MPDNITPISEINSPSTNPELLKSSTGIPPSLVPFFKILIGGLVLVALVIALALFKDRFPWNSNTSSSSNRALLADDLSQSFATDSFTINLPSGFTQKTIGNQVLLFADTQTANSYESCSQDANAELADQCGVVISVAIEAFSPDHDFSLEKTQSTQETYSLLSTTYTDALNRSWLMEPINAPGLAVIAETTSNTALHQATIIANAAPYQAMFGEDITSDRFLEMIKAMLSTIEFTNQ